MHASSTLHRMAIAAAILVCLERIAPAAEPPRSDAVVDLSLTVAGDLPCVWPAGMTPFAVVPTATFGRTGRHRDMLVIDEHTGTQWDAPAHFVPPPDSGLEGAGPMGAVTGEKVPAWQFCGEACVIDLSPQRDAAAAGESFLIGPEHVREWELAHRPLGPGDVVCFRTGYTDAYYRPFPAGDRFVSEALRKKAPGWAAPKPETMTYLADRGVTTLASDGASMGPLPNLAVATHQAGGRRGMVWVECATNLGSLPATGSFVAILAAKHAGGSGGECRMVAVTDPTLAAALIARARAHAVVDRSRSTSSCPSSGRAGPRARRGHATSPRCSTPSRRSAARSSHSVTSSTASRARTSCCRASRCPRIVPRSPPRSPGFATRWPPSRRDTGRWAPRPYAPLERPSPT
jgi:kynurenine formamidase